MLRLSVLFWNHTCYSRSDVSRSERDDFLIYSCSSLSIAGKRYILLLVFECNFRMSGLLVIHSAETIWITGPKIFDISFFDKTASITFVVSNFKLMIDHCSMFASIVSTLIPCISGNSLLLVRISLITIWVLWIRCNRHSCWVITLVWMQIYLLHSWIDFIVYH